MTDHKKLQIIVLGAGSIGCYLGGCLAAAGQDICFIGRNRIQNQLQKHGLHLSDWQGRKESLTPQQITFTTHIEAIANADYILLTVKSGDTASTTNLILAHAKPTAIIVSFQNGIQNVALLQQLLPQHKVVKAMVPFNVLNDEHGGFHCGTEGNLAIEANNNQYLDLIEAFKQANLPVIVHKDITGVQWGKLIMNLNNAVNALSGVPLLEQLNNREYRKIMTQVICEALRVMKHAGITPAKTGKVIPKLMPYILSLPNWLFKIVASATLKIDPKARSSMYEDFVLKRKTEIDFLNGEIVSLAKHHGLDAPVNRAIVSLVNVAYEKQAGSPNLTAKQIQLAISKMVSV
jgi:2-dehydropantoate 2-reductase